MKRETLKLIFVTTLALIASPLFAQDGPAANDPLKSLAFLEGVWEAKGQSNGGASASGTYEFRRELANHILARHSTSSSACKGPATFDCEHGDLLYVYADGPTGAVKAIYFDNEGHVIHYSVITPTPTSVIFLSERAPGPQFRLVYDRKDSSMAGKFQMQMPGQTEWKSYLEWSGTKKP